MTYEFKETENIEKEFLSGKSIPGYNKLESINAAKFSHNTPLINDLEIEGRNSIPLKENSCTLSNSINDEQGFSKIIPRPNINLNLYQDEIRLTKRCNNICTFASNNYEIKCEQGDFPLVEATSPKFIEVSVTNHNPPDDSIKYDLSKPIDKSQVRRISSIKDIEMIAENNNDISNKGSKISNKLNFISNYMNFDDSDHPKRYNKKNLDLGKNYFKNRYITEKVIQNRLQNEKSFLRKNSYFEMDHSQINENNSKIYLDDKLIIKFNSLFLKQLERGIFSFNLKKYEDSYNYLKENNIIKNVEEFGELLLVVQGFDKYIVGDFLSKEKPPNKGFIVLKSFMQKFCFTDLKFVDAFRLVLLRINLPKDSSLILNIVDPFAEIYYK